MILKDVKGILRIFWNLNEFKGILKEFSGILKEFQWSLRNFQKS